MSFKFKSIALCSLSIFALSSANATLLDFDDESHGEVAGGLGDTLVIGGVGITGSLSNNNLTSASSFNIGNTNTIDYSAYLDGGTNSGLGVYQNNTGVAIGSDDSFQNNVDGNINLDEILIFDFTISSVLHTVFFSDDHSSPTTSGYNDDGTTSGTSQDDFAIFNIFYSVDGISFTSALDGTGFSGSNNAQAPIGGEYISTGITEAYQYWAVAATGWSASGDTGFSSYLSAVDYTAVPEPSIIALFGLGLVGMGFVARKRKQA